MHRMLNEEALVDDADDVWDEDSNNASFDDVDFDEAAFDNLLDSDWPRAAIDACAPEGAFDARS